MTAHRLQKAGCDLPASMVENIPNGKNEYLPESVVSQNNKSLVNLGRP